MPHLPCLQNCLPLSNIFSFFLSHTLTLLQTPTTPQATCKPHKKHIPYPLHHPQWRPSSTSRSLFRFTPLLPPATHNGNRTDLCRNAASSASETVQGKGAEASKDANKGKELGPSRHILMFLQALPRIATHRWARVRVPPRMP